MEYRIIPLPKTEWKDIPVLIRYTTDEYYDLKTSSGIGFFKAKMVKKRFDVKITHTPEEYDYPDRLYQEH